MSAIVKDAIAEMVATEEKVVDAPRGPLGYGRDIDGDVDLHPQMREVDPFSTRAVAQALIRRLDCPRGALPDDEDYGFDLRGMLNRGLDARDIPELEGRIGGECEKDDRVDSIDVTVAIAWGPPVSLSVKLVVTPFDPRISSFRLTFAVTTEGIIVEELTAASSTTSFGGGGGGGDTIDTP